MLDEYNHYLLTNEKKFSKFHNRNEINNSLNDISKEKICYGKILLVLYYSIKIYLFYNIF